MRDDDERLDLSALDPARPSRRWEALVQRTVAASLPPQGSIWSALGQPRWAMAAFAACAVLAWVPAFTRSGDATTEGEAPSTALLVLHGADVVSLLESTDGR